MMLRRIIYVFLLLAFAQSYVRADYKDSEEFLAKRQAMHHAFNDGDSVRFFKAVKVLEDYLYQQGDLHAYYTQRCNEIVFLMNRQKIFEAYKLARRLSQELRERKLDKEMYMAYNMLGHIYRYCGNKDGAKRCFYEVLSRMESAGYRESMPPIYINLVNVEMERDPQEAMELLNKALEIAKEASPERVFDIETRRTIAYYMLDDTLNFLEGYKAYQKGKAEGLSSVHGRQAEVYYLGMMGKIDEAVAKAKEELGEDSYGTITRLYVNDGRWKEAYECQKKENEQNDSLNSVILSNSMQGIQDELRLYDAERRAAKNKLLALASVAALLLLMILALVYIILSRRRHMRELNVAYQHALESDRMKSAFIHNVSHEVRTPLNIINGFAQVMAAPEIDYSREERRDMAHRIQLNTDAITTLIDEMLELSQFEASKSVDKEDLVPMNELLNELIDEKRPQAKEQVSMRLDSKLTDSFCFLTNKKMLSRILASLLDNAVKYTEKGSVEVKASATEAELTLIVEDTGCGIPVSEAENIFGRFVKLDKFKVGIGLGLPLCRIMVKHLGGNVLLDTAYTEGARFVVTLPISS